jgi:5-methylcytosine-specific restriction enzyme A
LRDESILALDLYLREGKNADRTSRQQVSDLLRAIPIEQELAADPNFRGLNSVGDKLSNFVSLDPGDPAKGLSKHGVIDREVWDDFVGDPARLAATASAIARDIRAGETVTREATEDLDEEDAPEGMLLTCRHRVRERNRKLVARMKADAIDQNGRLVCVTCGFDFAATYGPRGQGYIECHHVVPLRDLSPGSRTKLSDLALLCANCHRMIHSRSPWLTVDQLRALLASRALPKVSMSS